MAAPATPAQLPSGWSPPSQSDETTQRAAQLASILNIQPSTYVDREFAALQIMSHLAAMPVIKDHAQRQQYGNEVLQNSNKFFPYERPETGIFFSRVQGLVITMQEFPAWYHNLTASNEDLVENYVITTYILWGMGFFGITGLAGTGSKVVGSALQSIPATIETSGTGAGAIFKGAAKAAGSTIGKTFTGGYASRSLIIAWIVGEVAATVLYAEQVEMKKEIIRRYQDSKLSAALYQKALGADIPPPQRYYFPIS